MSGMEDTASAEVEALAEMLSQYRTDCGAHRSHVSEAVVPILAEQFAAYVQAARDEERARVAGLIRDYAWTFDDVEVHVVDGNEQAAWLAGANNAAQVYERIVRDARGGAR